MIQIKSDRLGICLTLTFQWVAFKRWLSGQSLKILETWTKHFGNQVKHPDLHGKIWGNNPEQSAKDHECQHRPTEIATENQQIPMVEFFQRCQKTLESHLLNATDWFNITLCCVNLLFVLYCLNSSLVFTFGEVAVLNDNCIAR